MTVGVGPVRVGGDVAVVPIELSMADDAPDDASFSPTYVFASSITSNNLRHVRTIDREAGTVLLPGLDEEGRYAGTRRASSVQAGVSVVRDG